MDYKKKYLKYKSKYLSQKEDNTVITYIKEKTNILNSLYNSNIFFNQHNLNELSILNNYNLIKNIYENNNYIELRPYNNEKVLIIGCGNKRLDCGNVEPCDNIEMKQLYDKYHSHENAFTIDIALVANPSIVSYFNENIKFNTIPDHSFELIIFEGGGDPLSNPLEIQRLLKNTTNTMCIGMIDGSYYVYSYYFEGNYYIN